MGSFDASRWTIILVIYFFFLFCAVHLTVLAGDSVGIDEDIYYTEPAFFVDSSLSKNVECRDGSLPGLTAFCGQTLAYNYESCEIIPGCTYSNSTRRCTGIINLIDYGGRCSTAMPLDLCLVLGCAIETESGEAVTRITNSTEEGYIDTSTLGYNDLITTASIVLGFQTDLGLPPRYSFLFSFIVFWIPFFMLLVCFYMMLPFAH